MMSTLTRSLATFAEKEPSNVIVFSEQQLVGYSCSQMFKVVSDVDNYHNFVPYCRRSVVTLRKPQMLCANLNVGFHPFLNLSYTSHVTMVEPHVITAVCKDVKMFDHLKTVWKFTPSEDNDPKACVVDFAVSFSFISASHSTFAKIFLDRIVRENVAAFLGRVQTIHGPASRLADRRSVIVKKS